MSDLISRADAIEAVWRAITSDELVQGSVEEEILKLPSADADGDDLIIKGAKGIQDGLYNIKDGKLFKYKAKGGTVRTYPIKTDRFDKANQIILDALSADAESKVDSIVIRPTTYLSKSDFDKWAAEVKKESNRIIVIPHNSEVVVNTVKGLWVEERGDWYGGGAWVCSICGYGYSFGAYHEANEFRYCPNCGARMEANE